MSKTPAWREYLSVCADVIQVVTFFGLTLASFVAVLVMLVGWLAGVSWFWIAVGTPIAAIGSLLISAKLRHQQDRAIASTEQASSPELLSARIPLIEFFREAEKHGTDFRDASHAILDLCKELRQAGSDGLLQFWGRARFQNDPLLPIPKEHWYEYGIDWVPAFDLAGPNGGIKGIGTDNFFVMSRAGIDSSRKAYFDLHVNRSQALKLLPQVKKNINKAGLDPKCASFKT